MKNPRLAGEIIEKTARAIKKPLTVKIRKGFDDAHVNAVELAHIAQESGAAAVAVHGRTREQYYAGHADWDIITDRHHDVKIFALFPGLFVDRNVGCRGADHLCPVCSLPLKIQDYLPGQKRFSHPRLSFPRRQSGFWKNHHQREKLGRDRYEEAFYEN